MVDLNERTFGYRRRGLHVFMFNYCLNERTCGCGRRGLHVFMLNYGRIIASAIIEHGEQLETYVDNTSGSKKDKRKTKV